jgi:hypothetical protein
MKKTLLIAAAALAAGVISTQAQPVYSQNIVGYVNQTFKATVYTQVSVPLSVSSSNSAEQVFPAIQSGDAILLWGSASYDTYTFLAPGTWLYPDGSTVGPGPNLAVGQGLFFQSAVDETNTVVGNVVLSNTNNPVVFKATVYTLVGSLPPIGVSSLEDTNLNLPLQSGDAVLLWNKTSYDTYTFLAPDNWLYPDGSTVGPAPGLSVGQGFFYQAAVDEQWSQNMMNQ